MVVGWPQKSSGGGRWLIAAGCGALLLETVLDTVDVAIVACDADGHLTLANRTARELHRHPIELDGHVAQVYKRPHLEWFLREASKKFELVTFTAGMEHYGSAIMNSLDGDAKLGGVPDPGTLEPNTFTST